MQCVSSEEDGGLGTFAELERDAAFDAALIPEPTGWSVVCAQAGALTFRGVIPGRATHAATRLEGFSAIDRYVAVHAALAAHERAVNAAVEHPLMRELELPYPLLVGRVAGGAWSSQVPDRVEFEGRLGVPVGGDVAAARAALEAVVADALDDGEAPAEITWEGGSFAPAETAPDHPWVTGVAAAFAGELGRPVRPCGRAVGCGHAPLHRPRHPVHDGRDERDRARPRGRRAARALRAHRARARDRDACWRAPATSSDTHRGNVGAGRGRMRPEAIPSGRDGNAKGNFQAAAWLLAALLALAAMPAAASAHPRRGGRALRPVGETRRQAAQRPVHAGPSSRARPRSRPPATGSARHEPGRQLRQGRRRPTPTSRSGATWPTRATTAASASSTSRRTSRVS